jgi:hypothetical protein
MRMAIAGLVLVIFVLLIALPLGKRSFPDDTEP